MGSSCWLFSTRLLTLKTQANVLQVTYLYNNDKDVGDQPDPLSLQEKKTISVIRQNNALVQYFWCQFTTCFPIRWVLRSKKHLSIEHKIQHRVLCVVRAERLAFNEPTTQHNTTRRQRIIVASHYDGMWLET